MSLLMLVFAVTGVRGSSRSGKRGKLSARRGKQKWLESPLTRRTVLLLHQAGSKLAARMLKTMVTACDVT